MYFCMFAYMPVSAIAHVSVCAHGNETLYDMLRKRTEKLSLDLLNHPFIPESATR